MHRALRYDLLRHTHSHSLKVTSAAEAHTRNAPITKFGAHTNVPPITQRTRDRRSLGGGLRGDTVVEQQQRECQAKIRNKKAVRVRVRACAFSCELCRRQSDADINGQTRASACTKKCGRSVSNHNSPTNIPLIKRIYLNTYMPKI